MTKIQEYAKKIIYLLESAYAVQLEFSGVLKNISFNGKNH